VTLGDVSLPTLGPRLVALREEVVWGRGFQLLTGVPVERWSREQTVLAYWVIGLHWGKAVSNNKKGHLVGHIKARLNPHPPARRPGAPARRSQPRLRHNLLPPHNLRLRLGLRLTLTRHPPLALPRSQDIGHDPAKPETRLYATNAPQPYHNDAADVVSEPCCPPCCPPTGWDGGVGWDWAASAPVLPAAALAMLSRQAPLAAASAPAFDARRRTRAQACCACTTPGRAA
jgi:hypothetical protein